jgi:hypothetical protein
MFWDIEQEIYLHPREGLEEAFEPTSFARQIERLVNLMKVTLMDEGTGKRGLESGMLSHYHKMTLFCTSAIGLSEFSEVENADVVPAVPDSNDPLFWRYCLLEAQ